MGFFDKLKKGLNKTRENLTNKIEKLVIGYADIDDDFLDELEETLIMADVGVQTTDTLMKGRPQGHQEKRDQHAGRPQAIPAEGDRSHPHQGGRYDPRGRRRPDRAARHRRQWRW
jgi:signal recognition particle GTPase